MEAAVRQMIPLRLFPDERALLSRLAQDERRSLNAMIRELILREAQRRLVKAGGDHGD